MTLETVGEGREGDRPTKESHSSPELGEASAGASEEARSARLRERVAQTVATLPELHQTVLNHLFGLGGVPVGTHQGIADLLEVMVTDQLRAELAAGENMSPDGFTITADVVRKLEAAALRTMRGS